MWSQCTELVKFKKNWANVTNMLQCGIFKIYWHFLHNIPRLVYIQYMLGILWRKCQYILNIPHCNMLVTLAQFFLTFTGSVHYDHIVWKIVKIFLNFPNNFLTGKLKSHGLVYCKSTEHVLHLGYCRDIGSKYSKYTYNMLVRYVLSILAPVLTMYSACNGLVHYPSPPVSWPLSSNCAALYVTGVLH